MNTRVADYWQLTKPGITRHVVLAAAAGYWLGLEGAVAWPTLAALLAGTALVSGGTLAANQWWERDVDGRMPRTAMRPLPSGRISANRALLFAITLCLLGPLVLWLGTNALTALLAVATLLSYVFIYTPLKKRTTLNTLVGCFPGALPALGGWTASHGFVGDGGLALFAFLFVWQLPHAAALAWVYRADYAAGGLMMVGHDDPSGRRTALKASAYALLLLAATASLAPLDVTGAAAALAATAVTAGFLGCALTWAWRPSPAGARRTFLASIVHLTLVLALITIGR